MGDTTQLTVDQRLREAKELIDSAYRLHGASASQNTQGQIGTASMWEAV